MVCIEVVFFRDYLFGDIENFVILSFVVWVWLFSFCRSYGGEVIGLFYYFGDKRIVISIEYYLVMVVIDLVK